MIRINTNRPSAHRPAARLIVQALMMSASTMALAVPASAQEMLFNNQGRSAVEIGQRVSQSAGVTQIKLENGARLSFVDSAEYRVNDDHSVDLFAGSVTVAGGGGGTAVVKMPDGVTGQVEGAGSAAAFSVGPDGKARGHVLAGRTTIVRGNARRSFTANAMWAADGRRLRQVAANGPQSAPVADQPQDAPQVADIESGGPVAAAANGLPVSLGDALAGAGASSDILAAARRVEAANGNPRIETYPSGDLALLVARASDLSRLNGGTPFAGAEADIIRAYLGFLARGGARADFLAAYSGFLGQYLDLIRAGAAPSSFSRASLADINAFLAYRSRLGGLGELSAQNRALAEAYLAFLAGAGNPDLFAASYTDLVTAYFAFVRGGGDPMAFTGASNEVLDAYIAFLAESGLAGQLTQPNQQLLAAYLANGGLGFAKAYGDALADYFAFVQIGNLPSDYQPVSPAQLQQWLEILQTAGLFDAALGAQAGFWADYLAHLQGGGQADDFALLNANIFAGYSSQLAAYFDFLAGGGLPSAYGDLTQQQIADYVAALQAAGVQGAFLADLADFFSAYFAYLQTGADPDVYTGLPVLNLPTFADALNAYADFLLAGGLPSAFDGASLAALASYLEALDRSGQLAALLGANADLLNGYFAHLAGSDNADGFTGLPVYADYLAAVQAFYAYLAGGGLPSGYAALTQAQIEAYLAVLDALGLLAASFQGDALAFWSNYLAFLTGGGVPDDFGGFPSGTAFQLAGTAFVGEPVSVGIGAASVEIASNGTIGLIAFDSGSNRNFRDDANFTVAESGRVGETAAWTRYLRATSTSTPNWQNHVLVGAPSVNLPASGTAEYRLIGGTAPNNQLGTHAANGSFEGALAVAFGSSPGVGFEMDVYMDSRGWRASTNGGAANARFGGGVLDPATGLFSLGMSVSALLGDACVNACSAVADGGLFGEGGNIAGLVYRLFDDATLITGIAMFGTSGTELAMIGTRPTPPAAPSTLTNQSLAVANLFVGDDAVSGGSVTYDPQGRIVGYQSRVQEVFALGSASIAESDSGAGITWTRWASGTPAGDYYGTTSFAPLGANGGWHVVAGDALANMPASGTVAYDLVGFTTPTRTGEGTASGSVSGSAAVLFGANPRFGLDIDVTSGNDMLNLATDGGVTDVSQSRLAINAAGVFNSGGTNPQIITTNLAGNFCTSGCLSFVQGFLSGDGAAGAGLSYAIRQEGVNSQGFINGTAAFAKGDPIVTPVPITPAPSTGNPASAYVLTDHVFAEAAGTVPLNLNTRFGNLGNIGYNTDADGEITGLQAQSSGLYDRIGTASNAETGRTASGDIRWTRWTDGTIEQRRNGPITPFTMTADQGYHVIVGTPATNMPASGRIDYDLAGGTNLTSRVGAAAPGTLVSGAAAVEFGTQTHIGIEMVTQFNDQTFAAATEGGLANVQQSELVAEANGAFGAIGAFGNVTSSGTYCAATCRMIWDGFLAGDGATEIGLTYQIQASSSTERLIGTAAFVQTSGASEAGEKFFANATEGTIASGSAPADWDRWSVPAGDLSASSAAAVTTLAPGLEALAMRGIQFSPQQIQMLEARIAAGGGN